MVEIQMEENLSWSTKTMITDINDGQDFQLSSIHNIHLFGPLGIALPDMPLIQIVTLSALVAAKSAFAYPHPHSALYLYKRGGRPSTKPGWAVTANAIVGATIGGLLGVNTCSELPGTRGSS